MNEVRWLYYEDDDYKIAIVHREAVNHIERSEVNTKEEVNSFGQTPCN